MIHEITDQQVWDRLVEDNGGHPLQLSGWGNVKSAHGWRVARYELSKDPWAGAQVLLRPLPKGVGTFAYVPRGPVGKWDQPMLDELANTVKNEHKAITLSMEPDQEGNVALKGWKKSKNPVLLPQTLKLNLGRSEEELLEEMTKKTRQYIRKSQRGGVAVRRATSPDDIQRCLEVYKETARRAQFRLHGDKYYSDISELVADNNYIYVAEIDGKIEAFVWLIATREVAFELYGGVSDRGQEARANYCLKWFAITDMKKRGVKYYDMNGLLNDGISTFKRSFASHETTLVGTYDKPLSPLYFAWTYGLPAAKKIVRALKR